MEEKERIIGELKEGLKIRRYSESTIKRYVSVVNTYLNHELKKKKVLKEIKEKDVLEYLKELTEIRKYKSTSYNNVNAILKYLLEVVLELEISYKRLPNAKIGYRMPIAVTYEEYEKIAKQITKTRDKCWLMLAYGSGLRVSEIAKLKIEDIDSKNMKIHVIGKGNKERISVLPKKTLIMLRKYCKEQQKTKKEKYLFSKKDKEKHISGTTVSYKIKEYIKEAEIERKISAHSLRGGFATSMLKQKVDLLIVMSIMGHTSPETTSKYAELIRIDSKIKNPLDGEFNE